MNKNKKQQTPVIAVEKKSFWQLLANYLCPEGKKGARHVLLALLGLATVVASFWVVIYYICGPMEGYLHADYTDTIYWANASYESGKILDPDFKYAGLLPFSASIWFIPYISMFGVSMLAHKLGMITYLVRFRRRLYGLCSVASSGASRAHRLPFPHFSFSFREAISSAK